MDRLRIPIVNAQDAKYLEVENQEQTFAGVFRFDSVISKLDGTLQAQCQHMSDALGQSFLFRMSLLDQSKLKDQQDSFSKEGLLGWWKLLRCDSSDEVALPPRIKLQEALFPEDLESFRTIVLHSSSAPFIRDIQIKLLEPLEKK